MGAVGIEQQSVINVQVLERVQQNDLAFERHYTAKEIAKLWGYSRQTVTRIFEEEPGVLRVGRDESRYRRSYYSLRVPESVMKRVHQRLRQKPN